MQRVFVSNFFLLLLLNLIVKPVYILGIVAEVQNRVGEDAFGLFFALSGLGFLFNILLDLGINNFNTRQVAADEKVLPERFAKLLILRSALAVFYMVILWVAGWVLGYDADAQELLFWLGMSQLFSAFVLFFRSNLTGLHMFKHDSVVSVLDRLLLICAMSILLWTGITGKRFQIEWFVYAQVAAYGLTAAVALGMLIGKKMPMFNMPGFSESGTIIKQSLPYALLIFLMMVYYRTDGVMLERMLPDGAYQAGLYAKGFTLMEAGNMVTYLFAVLLLPIFTRMLKKGEDILPTLGLSFRWVVAGTWVLTALCVVFPDEILGLRFTGDTAEAAPVFALLMVSFMLFSLSYILSTALTARGDMYVLNRLAMLGMTLNILLNFILIPEFKAVGSAWASVLAHTAVVVGQGWHVWRAFKARPAGSMWLRFGLFAAGSLTVLWACVRLDLPWLWAVSVFGSASGLLMFATGFLSFKRFVGILRSGA